MRTFREFKSWDEVSPGDTLLWIVNGKYDGYTVEYVKPNDNKDFIHAIPIESKVPIYDNDDNDDYCADIYPTVYGSNPVGWAFEEKTFKYDPTQQPEDDSI